MTRWHYKRIHLNSAMFQKRKAVDNGIYKNWDQRPGTFCETYGPRPRTHPSIQFHWQFWINKSCLWLVNILWRKLVLQKKKEMKMIKTQILWWRTITATTTTKMLWKYTKALKIIFSSELAPLTQDVTFFKL